ncbi:Fumarylacetoacetate hydrolase family protein [Pyrodictium delaneyi]|uniref:Fumarylacetoacetate hydrolase family protein n=1 Tax=Pyrodictium delaneyi TaxID=1273541 RepID=A0A0N7JD79_9CREN|nr:fumarylacetoacetate hydrolase family protein [Pyrodictium delaneyi]ALL01441.1 Fumarylacetoacetate hydrolase family protein [Pyrodictium delaneyi]
MAARGQGFTVEAQLGLVRVLAPGGTVEPAVVYRGRVYPLGAWGYRDVREVMLETQPEEFERLARSVASSDRGLPLHGVRLAAPVDKPGKLVLVGLNYMDHAREVGMKPPRVPDLFTKTSNAVIGPGDPIILHDPGLRVDAEAELAAVIGLPGRSLEPEEALDVVWGYTCLNDVSARTEQLLSGATQWWRGKSRDTYAPIGPVIVPRSLLDPVQGLRLRLVISGETLQDGTTRDMIHSVAVLVSYTSRGTLLEPGDVIATGTPAGVGHARSPPRYLKPGDTVTVCVESIGCIENPVVADT